MKLNVTPKENELSLKDDEFIVSKTDTKGRITYANRVFITIAGYPEKTLLGTQHNIVRHPDMPRAVFRLLWDTLQDGNEFFGYVKNLCADGSYYWVFANITPDYDEKGAVQGYYSVRRKPNPKAINTMAPIYAEMLAIEQQSGTKEGPDKAMEYLKNKLHELGTDYESLVLSLQSNH